MAPQLCEKLGEAEHHLTFTFETGLSGGEYLTHQTIPIVGHWPGSCQ